MKKLSITMLIASLSVLSCQKENITEDKTVNYPENTAFNNLKNRYDDSYDSKKTYTLTEKREIPVQFNILYKKGKRGNRITDQDVQKQIQILNESFQGKDGDFRNTPQEFSKLASGDTKISFVLKGINRKETEFDAALGQQEWFKTKEYGFLAENTKKTLNIWILDSLYDEDGDDFAGYASPLSGDRNYWGIALNSLYFYDPSPSNQNLIKVGHTKGKILVHEVGHYFGLYHLSGPKGNCGYDLVSDTPPAPKEHYGFQKHPLKEVCHGVEYPQMFVNYMDYTADEQRTMFTKGQANKMFFTFQDGKPHQKLGLKK
ncbi:M43 family zinc metalloprotease [Flavobacterium davisii]|nr:M43 family zinc metalloprotease [Flavobacterium davisii]